MLTRDKRSIGVHTICLSNVDQCFNSMKSSYKKRGFAVFIVSTFAIASIMLTFIGGSEKADAQSPMDMMDMMMGGGNMTDGSMMMGDTGDNMSLPFNMGVLAMPMMCTTPNQLLGSLTGMMGGGMTGDDGNATQQMMMGLMQQQMMSGAGGMENMTEAELQHVMNMVICLPAMNEEMMQSMMGNGQNSTSSMMSGMMMQ
jgi:hypothetical protein